MGTFSSYDGTEKLELNRNILRLFGIKFFGSPTNPVGGSWNSSRKEGLTLDEVAQILVDSQIPELGIVGSKEIVEEELSYKVLKGADFTYRFEQIRSPGGEDKYRLVKDARIHN